MISILSTPVFHLLEQIFTKKRHTHSNSNKLFSSNQGVEYQSEIQNCNQWLSNIIHNELFSPQLFTQDYQSFSNPFKDLYLYDNRNEGSFCGMAILGILGFVALGFSIVGAMVGGALGVILGRYAGKKSKRINPKASEKSPNLKSSTQKCVAQWLGLTHRQSFYNKAEIFHQNLNVMRFVLEKVMSEIKMLTNYRYFAPNIQNKTKQLLKKVRKLLIEEIFTDSLILTLTLAQYLLFHINNHKQTMFEYQKNINYLSIICCDVLKPALSLLKKSYEQQISNFEFEIQLKKENSPRAQILSKEIQNFLISKDIQNILHNDIQSRVDYIKMYSADLNQIIVIDDIEQFANDNKIIIDLNEIFNQAVAPIMSNREINIANDQISQEINLLENNLYNNNSYFLSLSDIKPNFSEVYSRQIKLISSLSPKQNQQQIKIETDNDINSPQTIRECPNTPKFNSFKCLIKQSPFENETIEKQRVLNQIIEENILNYKLIYSKEKIQIFFKTNANGQFTVRGSYLFDSISQNILLNAIKDPKQRKYWDKVTKDYQVIKPISNNTDLVYFTLQSFLPFINSRDFLQIRCFLPEFPNIYQQTLLYYSIYDKSKPEQPKFVRVHTFVSAFVISQIENGSQIEFYSQCDLKGNICFTLLKFLIQKYSSRWIKKLEQFCKLKQNEQQCNAIL